LAASVKLTLPRLLNKSTASSSSASSEFAQMSVQSEQASISWFCSLLPVLDAPRSDKLHGRTRRLFARARFFQCANQRFGFTFKVIIFLVAISVSTKSLLGMISILIDVSKSRFRSHGYISLVKS